MFQICREKGVIFSAKKLVIGMTKVPFVEVDSKTITWTEDALQGFEQLKHMINTYPKLYSINNTYKIVLYTDALDYEHGAYQCHIKPATETSAEIQHIRFLSGIIQRHADKMVDYRVGSFRDILKKLDDLLGGIAFTTKTDHRNLLYKNNHGSRKVLQWKHYNATIEHAPGVLNTPTDVFSTLVEKDYGTT